MGRDPAYVVPDAHVKRPSRSHTTLLSPFDSLIWERDRTSRLFDFEYRIEVYMPEPKRTYGYFVLPLLLGDRIVGRFDLKSDRKTSALQVPRRVRGAGRRSRCGPRPPPRPSSTRCAAGSVSIASRFAAARQPRDPVAPVARIVAAEFGR